MSWSSFARRRFRGWIWGAIAILALWGWQVQAGDLPTLQVHALPSSLSRWQDPGQSGDYFDQIKTNQVGYLVWSDFPIKVYVQAPEQGQTSQAPGLQKQARDWSAAVVQAVQEWQAYLPLQLVTQSQDADIAVWRSTPPTQRKPGGDRARSAETRYEVYVAPATPQQPPRLRHRCQILLRPSQAPKFLQSAARHELGHALGIWGHSLQPTDTMYYAQVRNPPAISARDVNTLKRIYQQPTRLGWPMPAP